MKSVGSHSTPGREKEGKKEGWDESLMIHRKKSFLYFNSATNVPMSQWSVCPTFNTNYFDLPNTSNVYQVNFVSRKKKSAKCPEL